MGKVIVITPDDLNTDFNKDGEVSINIDEKSIQRNEEGKLYVDFTKSSNTYIAGEYINQCSVVYIGFDGKVYMYSNSDLEKIDLVVGVSYSMAFVNTEVEVITKGYITGFFGITPGVKYYASTGGGITDIPPTNSVQQFIGVGVDSTSISVNIQRALIKTI